MLPSPFRTFQVLSATVAGAPATVPVECPVSVSTLTTLVGKLTSLVGTSTALEGKMTNLIGKLTASVNEFPTSVGRKVCQLMTRYLLLLVHTDTDETGRR